MDNHTPGPWRTIDDAQGPCMIMHPTKPGIAIASLTDVHKPSNGFHNEDNWPEERNANARLIASAPTLLENLINMTVALNNWTQIIDGRLERLNVHDELLSTVSYNAKLLMTDARAAIAKATGEEV